MARTRRPTTGQPAPKPQPRPVARRGTAPAPDADERRLTPRQDAVEDYLEAVAAKPRPAPRPAPKPAGGTTPPTGAQQATNADALAVLSSELQSWGFGQDAITWAASEVASNKSTNQILFDLRNQNFYKNSIFGQVATARQAAGLPAMTEAQILAYKDYVVGVTQQAGLPTGFINDPELVTLMGHDVSTAELDARVTQGFTQALKAPPDVLAQLNQYYGIDTGHLAAYYLDPAKALPILQQQFTAAQLGAAATRTGYGALTSNVAQQLAQLGVTESQGETSFAKLGNEAQLFNALPGSGEQAISQQVQLAAEFGGNAQAQQEITQRADERKAEFSGSYRFAETQGRGITGLGPAPRNG